MVMAFQVAPAVKNPPANARDVRDAILLFLHDRMLRGAGGYGGGRQISFLFNPQVFQINELFSRNHTQRTSSILGLTETNKDSRF